MIESYENALQITVLSLCACAAAYQAFKAQSKTWTFLAFFYGNWLLGDIYWLVCLIFYQETPLISAVSDLSWYATFIFLYMLLRQAVPLENKRISRILPWSGPVLSAGMAVFFMQWGEYFNNLVYASLMGLLMYASLERLSGREKPGRYRFLCRLILAFCLLEYALWTASCFLKTDSLSEPYYWFDLMLTCTFPLFLPAVRKAVAS